MLVLAVTHYKLWLYDCWSYWKVLDGRDIVTCISVTNVWGTNVQCVGIFGPITSSLSVILFQYDKGNQNFNQHFNSKSSSYKWGSLELGNIENIKLKN